jgi:hypothetical protein
LTPQNQSNKLAGTPQAREAQKMDAPREIGTTENQAE